MPPVNGFGVEQLECRCGSRGSYWRFYGLFKKTFLRARRSVLKTTKSPNLIRGASPLLSNCVSLPRGWAAGSPVPHSRRGAAPFLPCPHPVPGGGRAEPPPLCPSRSREVAAAITERNNANLSSSQIFNQSNEREQDMCGSRQNNSCAHQLLINTNAWLWKSNSQLGWNMCIYFYFDYRWVFSFLKLLLLAGFHTQVSINRRLITRN